MLRNVVGSAIAGFQKAAVSSEFDEDQIRHKRLREDIGALEGLVRQLMLETASLRAELGEVKAELARVQSAPRTVEKVERSDPPRAIAVEKVEPSGPPLLAPQAPTVEAKAAPKAEPAPKPEAAPAPKAEAAPKPAPKAEAAPAPKPEAAPKAEAPSFANLAAMAATGQLGPIRHADDASTDIEAYRERMRANGRSVELAGEGLNVAADGATFIGPVDNESSRAKAVGKVLTIDQWECIACGTCVEQTADVYYLPDGEKAQVLKQQGPMDLIQDAIDACPVTCISWIEPGQIEEQHSHGGFGG